nr:hypothetical protein [Tanacetum cinerariifolium]
KKDNIVSSSSDPTATYEDDKNHDSKESTLNLADDDNLSYKNPLKTSVIEKSQPRGQPSVFTSVADNMSDFGQDGGLKEGSTITNDGCSTGFTQDGVNKSYTAKRTNHTTIPDELLVGRVSLLSMANLHKLKANVPNDVDYDVWLPLASIHEVNDRIKNSLYGYFIGKRLAFSVVEWFVRNN